MQGKKGKTEKRKGREENGGRPTVIFRSRRLWGFRSQVFQRVDEVQLFAAVVGVAGLSPLQQKLIIAATKCSWENYTFSHRDCFLYGVQCIRAVLSHTLCTAQKLFSTVCINAHTWTENPYPIIDKQIFRRLD